jgi:hypothetical protein
MLRAHWRRCPAAVHVMRACGHVQVNDFEHVGDSKTIGQSYPKLSEVLEVRRPSPAPPRDPQLRSRSAVRDGVRSKSDWTAGSRPSRLAWVK